MTTKKLTKKAYREYLNQEHGFAIDKRGTLKGATKRLYGDYLYAADKEMFDVQYKEWLEQQQGAKAMTTSDATTQAKMKIRGILARVITFYRSNDKDMASENGMSVDDAIALLAAREQSAYQRGRGDALGEAIKVAPEEKIRPASGPQRNGTSQTVRRAFNAGIREYKQAIAELKGAKK